MKQTIQFVLAAFTMLAASAVFAASGLAPDPEVPNWVYMAIGMLTTIVGFIAHADAQVSEEFKAKWPWWLRFVWDFAAGNYKHSQNIGSV
ncbi:hypothetical protein [Vibrio hepatarius]|uniref:hypothetical protein n=1 Tax=Vibrio hepatarius TaxID=171383 RepID=UPI001C0984E8|nr:hypothetical protein [Vibrio hepatarius]MBU2897698.1 hypothetical protein [Vibrio hepatarius]